MTNDEIMKLEGVALAEAVAREVMGWTKHPTIYALWVDENGIKRFVTNEKIKVVYSIFAPHIDHNHAAEVIEKMLELYPDYEWETKQNDLGCAVRFVKLRDRNQGWGNVDALLPLSICRVALLAKAALG